ncbi:phenylalanine--tRNA ligase subunit alpha [Sulfobacillus thermosulfidooxidans]|uniref:phenylalanine--tRNA ligase subunit alpha n=1 Tax=Sulfobacillus thermosulfidooxidans TaxID=28034 RepID=UPI00096BC37F|nr:phenylalanine--tRNA ligase subunit alpha [Sulfobacillus thermosulfidooxidans]OLZ09826.1 phenylalanine--tRNA ligase subunit alpha [Sulfobacillus thermosulfidooxidans]OLZ15868.1 phenylalanine--tRNA ligase subunit alpha [Sulfobacillus thermosulfidooxidans]OLZ18285.1 phenylalanine--tRNA ligase subunit alpha [Sulfobacillus thermosulfidooxidans]
MDKQFEEWHTEIMQQIHAAQTLSELQSLRSHWLGRRGIITLAMKGLSSLSIEERRSQGQQLNALRETVLELLTSRQQEMELAEETMQLQREQFDMTLPGSWPQTGLLHPITRTRRFIEDVFLRMGFSLEYGPEIEHEWYNFEALNMPANHPARDMQDSFFINVPGMVLRTHTSPVQIRAMKKYQGRLPVRIIAPGRAFRRDDDATHVPMFFQVEGLVIDHGITLADLKGTLTTMAQELLGTDIRTRFRPSYFPFTEPSVEMDVTCASCGGTGCRVCKGTGWVEILGSGMVHPVVLTNGGYDPSQVSGFAFGLGIERLAMRIFGIDDLRLLYQNDMQFLSQFQSYIGRPIL